MLFITNQYSSIHHSPIFQRNYDVQHSYCWWLERKQNNLSNENKLPFDRIADVSIVFYSLKLTLKQIYFIFTSWNTSLPWLILFGSLVTKRIMWSFENFATRWNCKFNELKWNSKLLQSFWSRKKGSIKARAEKKVTSRVTRLKR